MSGKGRKEEKGGLHVVDFETEREIARERGVGDADLVLVVDAELWEGLLEVGPGHLLQHALHVQVSPLASEGWLSKLNGLGSIQFK